jgi:para-nitrobenzyl esterase
MLCQAKSRWIFSALLAASIGCAGPAGGQAEQPGAAVEAPSGRLEGSIGSDGLRVFLGIPYTAPPVGPLRWREPQPALPWQGTLRATSLAPACVQPASPWQPDADPPRQSEDCLYLNIWAPAEGAEKLPVMVWFHGGGLMVGSATDGFASGEHLARKGAVVVTVNYRLGPLGFLVLRELSEESSHGTSGNYGLLDQIQALKWVRDNIAAFGGDPGNVTVFGFSAGSTSINALQSSPLARGLFHRAIGQSTAQMIPAAGIWQLRTFAEAEAYGEDYKRALGVGTVDELRSLPAEALVEPPHKFWLIEGDRSVLPDEVYDTFAEGEQTPVPVLAGATANEETTLATAAMLNWLRPRSPADEAAFNELYGAEGALANRSVNDVILWQMREWVRLNQQRQPNSYLYYFTHHTPRPSPQKQLGAYHGAELPYAFGTLASHDWDWTDEDRRLANIVSGYWVNFARTGNPNGPGLPYWPAYTDEQVMELSSSPGPIATPSAKALQVLDAYYERERHRDAGVRPR